MGTQVDGSDSIAVEIAPASHWPTMRALILVASAAKKGVSSTSGMQTTVTTSELFQRRVDFVVPAHMTAMTAAILSRDFQTFGKVTMMDSNSFHATCADTYPPIHYLKEASFAAIRVVESINKKAGRIIAAYTFDAGPNAVIYYEEANTDAVAGTLKAALGGLEGWKNREIAVQSTEGVDASALQLLQDGISRVILTSVGEGPISTTESLL
jgi:diphosphomevalonate decarboxylase